MKRKISIIIMIILIIALLIIGSLNKKEEEIIQVKEPIIKENINIIEDLKKQYNNDDIVAYLEIPNVLKQVVVQTKDNDYYLNYNINKEKDINGATFLDYRNNFNDVHKLLIYGHSDPEGQLPFVNLKKFNNQEFYENNKYIYLTTKETKYKYEIFASYIENYDFDYVNLNGYNGLTYKEHLDKLKNNSIIKSNIELKEDNNILILQTCSFDKSVKGKLKYQLVMAVMQ